VDVVVPPQVWQSHVMSDADKIMGLPCWNGRVDIALLGGGLSNANFLVRDAGGQHVVRFGVDYPFHHVTRLRELMVARAAHAAGFAPAVEYAEAGVMVTAFVNGRTFSADDVKANAARIGTLMRAFHREMPQRISGQGFMFWVFHVIRDYAKTLRLPDHEPLLLQAMVFEAAQVPLPIIFGHNDLLPANFLDDGGRLWLIDFEYAGFGTAMFDLAGVSSNAQMNGDEQMQLLFAYFGAKPEAAVMKSFAAMECASLLRETLWARVSGLFLAAPGVDYGAYAEDNLNRYMTALEAYQLQYGKTDL
jgi:thiamine kinase-like enzyme